MHSTFVAADVPVPTAASLHPPPDAALADVFFANPWGPHGPALQAVLNVMRGAPCEGKLVVVPQPDGAWQLARLPPRGGRLEMVGEALASRADAERAAFRLRWQALTGRDPP